MKHLHTAFLLLLATPLQATELPTAKPEAEGMSSRALQEAKATLAGFVKRRQIAGANILIARNGKVVFNESVGFADIAKRKPYHSNTVVRIYSMTKPITSVAIMQLVERGKINLDAPVSKYIPELRTVQVLVHNTNGQTRKPKRAMTVRDLLRHTSGLTYGFFGNTAVDRQYRRAQLLRRNGDWQESIAKLAKIPLLDDPGSRFRYSIATDILGVIVQRVSKQRLDRYFQQHILKPLGMHDTAFQVGKPQTSRFANNYGSAGRGLYVRDRASRSRYLTPPKLHSGGGGLVSTTRDYMRFCQMLLNQGKLGKSRILLPSTVSEMTKNQLSKKTYPIRLSGGPRQGVGFGLGVSVVVERIDVAPHVPVGEYGWGGVACTHFFISPKHKLAVVLATQYMPFSMRLEYAVKPHIYRALQKK